MPYHDVNNLKLNDYLHIHVDERWENFDDHFFQDFIDKIKNVSYFDNILITSNIILLLVIRISSLVLNVKLLNLPSDKV